MRQKKNWTPLSRRPFPQSLRNALRGWTRAVVTGRNMRIQLSIFALALFFGTVGRIEPWAWALILLSGALVLGCEALNTALERLCDRVSTAREKVIGDVKDIAAGAVLFCAAGAAGVGLLVFARAGVLRTVADLFMSAPAVGVALFALLALIILFVRGKKEWRS